MTKVAIAQSSRTDKRYMAMFPNKTVHFGYKHGSAYVDHKSDSKRNAWKKRHGARGTLNNLETASGLANHVLWNKTSVSASIQDMNSKQSKYKFVLQNRGSSK